MMTYRMIGAFLGMVVASAVLACAGGGESPDWDDPACVALALSGLPCSSGGGTQQVVTVQQIQQMEDPTDPVCPGTSPRVVMHNMVLTAVDTYDEDESGRVGDV